MSRPVAGVRLVVVKAEETAAAVIYRGHAHLPDADVPITITVALPDGATRATLGEGGERGDAAMEKRAAALVRAATRGPLQAGSALPRKIVRWRA